MKSGLIYLVFLFLGICVVVIALPEYREMDRKDEFFRGCMEMQAEGRYDKWTQIMNCNRLWNGGQR